MLRTNQGPVASIEYTGGVGLQATKKSYLSGFQGFNVLAGYQINRSYILAGGTGLEIYDGHKFVPLLTNVRYAFRLNQLTTYLFADGGLILDLEFLQNPRIFLTPGIGSHYALNKQTAINFSIGFRIQSSDQKIEEFIVVRLGVFYKFHGQTERKTTLSRLEL